VCETECTHSDMSPMAMKGRKDQCDECAKRRVPEQKKRKKSWLDRLFGR